MEDKKIKGRKIVLPAANSFSSHETKGWMIKLIHEGWLRKRWRKRFCVLSNGILYSYDQETCDGTEKTCGTVNLKYFEDCVRAQRKECKKSPYTLILEPIGPKNTGAETTKSSVQVTREFFYTENQDDLEKWILKLKESISLSNIGSDSKLKHVTKSRARPPRGSGGNRRPPTKQHLKERAMMSEIAFEDTGSKKDPPKPRGHTPSAALKPRFPGKNMRQSPKTKEATPRDIIAMSDSTSEKPLQREMPQPPGASLKPGSIKLVGKTIESESDALAPLLDIEDCISGGDIVVEERFMEHSTPKSPTPPPASLKPSSTKRVETLSDGSRLLDEATADPEDPEKYDTSNIRSAPTLESSDIEGTDEKSGKNEFSSVTNPDVDGKSEMSVDGSLHSRQNGQVETKVFADAFDNKLSLEARNAKSKSLIFFDTGSIFTDDASTPVATAFGGKPVINHRNKTGRPSSLVYDAGL